MRFINQEEAKLLDEKLMSSEYAFSLDQLMELAGLSVAEVAQEYYCQTSKRILVCCGRQHANSLLYPI